MKVWCIICIVGRIFAAITNFVIGFYPMAILSIVGTAFYAWLLMGKKCLALFLIMAKVTVGVLMNIANPGSSN